MFKILNAICLWLSQEADKLVMLALVLAISIAIIFWIENRPRNEDKEEDWHIP